MASEDASTSGPLDSTKPTTAELIEGLSQFEGQPQEFLVSLLAAQCHVGSARGGAFLRMNPEGHLEALAMFPPPAQPTDPAPSWLAQAAEIAGEVMDSQETAIRPAHRPEDLYGQPAERHLILIPVPGPQGAPRGLAVFLIEDQDARTVAASREKLELTISLLGLYEMRLTLQRRNADLRRLRSALEVLASVNNQQRFRGLGMALVNELASRWECERVGVGILKGRYVRLAALSHTEKFSRKMRIVQDLEATMEECLDQDVEVVYPAAPTTTFVNRCAQELSRRHGPTCVLSLPLRREGACEAVLTLERPTDQPFALDEAETLRLTGDLCSARLLDLHKTDRWFGARWAAGKREGMATLIGPKHTWAKAAALAVLGFVLFLTFARGNYTSEGTFVFEPIDRRVLPAPFEGQLAAINAEPGQRVEAGEILAELDTAKLRLRWHARKAERDRYQQLARAATRDHKTAEAEVHAKEAESIQAEMDLLRYQIDKEAKVRSPIDGVVVSEDIKRRIGIGGPTEMGDILFEVAPLTRLRADLFIPEDEIADVAVGQEGELAGASDPSRHVSFTVERIHPVAEVLDQKNVFKVRVTLERTEPWMRPGMEGVGKIYIGKKPYGRLWTRKLVNWLRMRLWW